MVHTFAAVVKITADVCPDPVASAVLKTAFAIYEEAMKVSELKVSGGWQHVTALADSIVGQNKESGSEHQCTERHNSQDTNHKVCA